MKILYVALKYDYGLPERGYSFEHYNFYESLLNMGHDILYFDFMTLLLEDGRESMNERLLKTVRAEKPDLMFTALFKDELDPDVVKKISEETETITINWFCDDHWRFDDFSSRWAPNFNWVVTTAQSALPKYREIGYRNVIKSQWACNHFSYRKLDPPPAYDITFVGQPHGNRREVIDALRQANLSVKAWGLGWEESGRLSQAEMIDVFNRSRINLNLSNASVPVSPDISQTRRRASKALDFIPFGGRLKTVGKHLLSNTAIKRAGQDQANIPREYHEQIKGRNFEIPGCGGFLLTGMADNLEDYYEPDNEIVCFSDENELVEKANYYLRHEDERRAIAKAGFERTLREHTYAHRFNDIFRKIGLR